MMRLACGHAVAGGCVCMGDILVGNDEQAGGQRELIAHCALSGGD